MIESLQMTDKFCISFIGQMKEKKLKLPVFGDSKWKWADCTFRKNSSTRGFSLMEVLVGISILGIVYTTLFGLLTTSLRNMDRIGEREKIARYGQSKLNELVIQVSRGEIPSPLFGELDEQYRWQAQVETYDKAEDSATLPFSVSRIRLEVLPAESTESKYALETFTWTPNEE